MITGYDNKSSITLSIYLIGYMMSRPDSELSQYKIQFDKIMRSFSFKSKKSKSKCALNHISCERKRNIRTNKSTDRLQMTPKNCVATDLLRCRYLKQGKDKSAMSCSSSKLESVIHELNAKLMEHFITYFKWTSLSIDIDIYSFLSTRRHLSRLWIIMLNKTI